MFHLGALSSSGLPTNTSFWAATFRLEEGQTFRPAKASL
jgi:hypothetical protein